MKQKTGKILLLTVLLIALLGLPCHAQEKTEVPGEWQEIVDEAPITAEEFQSWSVTDYLEKGVELLLDKAAAPLRLFARLCGILVLCAVVRAMAEDLPISPAMQLMETITALACFTLSCPTLLALLGLVQDALLQSRSYLAAFVPVFAGALVSCGQAGSAAVYSGLFFGICMLLADVLCRGALPLTRIIAALHATGTIGPPLDTVGIAQTMEKWLKWLLTLCATLFAALLGLQSALAQGADNLALKTGKFIVSSSIPVVGRAVSDAMGSVLAGFKLLKGTLGFAAVAVLSALFLPLLAECALYHLVFSLAGIVAASTGSQCAEKLLRGMASCVSLYLSMVFLFWMIVTTATMVMLLMGGG